MTSVKSRRSRRRNSSAKGNILTISVPGLKRSIDIEFPDNKLPVCQRCKKIYKTRELCRVRDGHTDIPWNTTYICISFDDTCLTFDDMGELCLVDEERMHYRFIAKLLDEPPLPFRAKKIYEDDIHSPICTPCKEKNYTRHHCREKQQHTQLPWVTMYVMLSATHNYEPADKTHAGISDQNRLGILSDGISFPQSSQCGLSHGNWTKDNCATTIEGVKSPGKDCIDNIHKVPMSRSCLLTVNNSSKTLRWLEIDPCVPRTEYKSIPSFTGNPSPIMNQWHDMTNRFLSAGNIGYSSRGAPAGAGLKIDQEYHANYLYYPNYQNRCPPMHGQGVAGVPPFYDYSNEHFNPYNYQQTEHDVRQLYTGKYGRHQIPPENPVAVNRDNRNGDYYTRFYNHSNLSYIPSQMSASSHVNDYSHKASSIISDQQEGRGTSWSHTPDRQGHALSTTQSPENGLPTYESHHSLSVHSDGGENSHQSHSQEDSKLPKENFERNFWQG